MSHRPTKCCPATEHRMSVCLRNPCLLCALCRKQTWEWAQWVWMDSGNIEHTCLFFRFNSGQPRSSNLCVWISHWEPLSGCCGWLNSPASEEEMPMESSVCFVLLLSALFTKSRWEEAHLSTLLALFSIQRKLSFVNISFKTKVLILLCDLPILKGITLSSRTRPLVFIFGFITGGPCSSTTSSEDLQRSHVSLIGFISEMLLLICETWAVHCSHSTDGVLYCFFLEPGLLPTCERTL